MRSVPGVPAGQGARSTAIEPRPALPGGKRHGQLGLRLAGLLADEFLGQRHVLAVHMDQAGIRQLTKNPRQGFRREAETGRQHMFGNFQFEREALALPENAAGKRRR